MWWGIKGVDVYFIFIVFHSSVLNGNFTRLLCFICLHVYACTCMCKIGETINKIIHIMLRYMYVCRSSLFSRVIKHTSPGTNWL